MGRRLKATETDKGRPELLNTPLEGPQAKAKVMAKFLPRSGLEEESAEDKPFDLRDGLLEDLNLVLEVDLHYMVPGSAEDVI